MNGGMIKCDCGQEQWVETVNDIFSCIRCGEMHEVYPLPKEEPPKEGEEDETRL